MKPTSFHPDALADYGQALTYYTDIDPDLGRLFNERVEATLAAIARSPALPRMFAPPVRRRFVERFPYALLYVDRPSKILIVAVMHLHRHPTYWGERLI